MASSFECRALCLEISGQLSGLIHYHKNSDLRGEKFKKDVSRDKKAVSEAGVQ